MFALVYLMSSYDMKKEYENNLGFVDLENHEFYMNYSPLTMSLLFIIPVL